MKVVNYVQIDFSRNKDITVPSIQYDSGTRWVMVKLYNNGVPIDLHDLKVFIMAVKPDGKEVFNNCNVIDPDDGLIKFEITEQMGFVKGEVECQIKLMDQDRLLSSDIFKLNVNKSLSFENSESTNQLTTLVDALYRVEHLDAELSGEFRDTFNASQLEREESFNDSQMDREEVFNSSQLNREETFNVSETERENIFDNSQVNHEERFNASQAEREDKFNDKLDQFEERFLEIKGEKGDKGEQGPVGPQGPKGDKGDRGLDGRSVELGVYGGQVKWRYAGQEENVGWTPLISLDSLRGSQGPQGEKGETGPQGPKGEKGDSGGVMPTDMVDYMGNQHETLKAKNDADVDWLLGEINTAHYEGQQITATDSIEGRAKSAILKGQTLVNLINDTSFESTSWIKYCYESCENGVITFVGNGQRLVRYAMFKTPVIKNKTYTAFVKIKSDCTNVGLELETNDGDTYIRTSDYIRTETNDFILLKAVITVKNHNTLTFVLRATELIDGNVYFKEPMLLEGDYTNQDIPHFEGMQSVKLPVLTTTGKNVFNIEDFLELEKHTDFTAFGSGYNRSFVINGEPNTTYVISRETNEQFTDVPLSILNSDGLRQAFTNVAQRTRQITTTSDGKVYLSLQNVTQERLYLLNEKVKQIQVEIGDVSTATTYEPYRTNILSTPEDLELRGIGDVQDTLDCMTGEVVQNVGEMVLDGSENYLVHTTGDEFMRFKLTMGYSDVKRWGKSVSNNFAYNRQILGSNNDLEICNGDGAHEVFLLNIHKSRLSTNDVTGFKNWLSQNNTIIQYELSNSTVKTVVFKEVDQDGNETVHENGAIIYSHKDTTHYICGSEDSSLIPSLSIDVPTNLPAVVTRQKTMIHELEVENKALVDELQRVEEKSDQADLEQLSTTWEIDYRVSELEWFVEDNISSTMTVAEKINLKLGGNTMALSRFEQAKILILAGAYNRETLEKQLTNYLKRGYLTTEEYDELIALMGAKELVSEN